MKDSVTIGHLRTKENIMSVLIIFTYCIGGNIICIVATKRCYSADLPQGGLEVPCLLIFKAQSKEIQKLKVILRDD